ncbi:alpha-L-fucosidase [Lentzea atacamensis]|uniref:alpha-L-fucosidase n=1 Tax=Lentzea atacamensis TaxID=531938 RepID=UPI001C023452
MRTAENLSDVDYQRYFDRFDPDLCDPAERAADARAAGARYVVITAQHHDGDVALGLQRQHLHVVRDDDAADRGSGGDHVRHVVHARDEVVGGLSGDDCRSGCGRPASPGHRCPAHRPHAAPSRRAAATSHARVSSGPCRSLHNGPGPGLSAMDEKVCGRAGRRVSRLEVNWRIPLPSSET